MTDQRTEEWHQMRLGKVTASRIADVMMKPTTAGYQNYLSQLVCERLTGRPTDSYQSAAMLHGIETEDQARAMYEMVTGKTVHQVAFIDHPTIPMTGASPDGLVGDNGMVEIKCPQPTEHIRTLRGGAIKRPYLLQMQWQMACAGRDWCDFVSFNADLPDTLMLHCQRVERDDALIAEIEAAVTAFLAEVDKAVADLEAML